MKMFWIAYHFVAHVAAKKQKRRLAITDEHDIMKKFKKIILVLLIFACLTLAFVPFIVPVPEQEGLVSEQEFVDEESKFIENETDLNFSMYVVKVICTFH